MKRTGFLVVIAVLALTAVSLEVSADQAEFIQETSTVAEAISYSSAFLAKHPRCVQRHSPLSIDTLSCSALSDLDTSEGEMKSIYDKQLAKLQSKDSKEYLAKTQQQWLAFRDAECGYEMSMWAKFGAERNARYLYCQSRKNKQRIDVLKGYIACSDNDCPR